MIKQPARRLRRYQIEDLNQIIRALNADVRRVCYQAPTGSGKTVTFCRLIAKVAEMDDHVMVLGHREEIVRQISTALHDLGIPHGIIAPGYPETDHKVQVGSVFTVVRRLDRLWEPRLLVIDECHHAVAASWRKVIDEMPDTAILGVTATPRRLDGKPLDDIFEQLITGPSIGKLVDEGYLAPVTVFAPPHRPDLSKVKIRAGDYAVEQLREVMSHGIIVKSAIDEYERLCAHAPAIAFCVDIAHSKLVAKALADRGYRAEHVDGDTPRQQRRQLISALGNDIEVLCNCGLISEGLDVPSVVAGILLRPTKSLALYLQMVGRTSRPAAGKETAYVLDHAGNVYRHGLPTAHRRWSLHGRVRRQTETDNTLMRCPSCGAMNLRTAVTCVHCGAALHQARSPRIEVAGRQLVEAVAAPTTNADLAGMSYRESLQWAAAPDGRLRHDRLQQVGNVRGYKPGWAYYNSGRHWQEVWANVVRWRQRT